MKTETSVLVVDEDAFLSTLLCSVLNNLGFKAARVSSPEAALEYLNNFTPDVLITEFEFVCGSTFQELASRVQQRVTSVGVVILTTVPHPSLLGFEERGIPREYAYLHKARIGDTEEIARAIKAVQKGYVNKSMRHEKSHEFSEVKLSRTQIDAIRLVADGWSNQRIAEERQVAERTVESLLGRTYKALGFTSGDSHQRVLAVRAYLQMCGISRR
ncbi:MAG: hypothetical protein RL243_628 [Actinomycetota bacterium]